MKPVTASPRLVGTALRLLLALPRPMRRTLAGAPIVVDGQQLDPVDPADAQELRHRFAVLQSADIGLHAREVPRPAAGQRAAVKG